MLGLNNANLNKKERLISDEVNANNSNILMNLELGYKNRELGLELVNKKFDLDIKLEKTINTLDVSFTGNEKKLED